MLQRYKKYYTCAKKILLFIYIATPFLCCGKRDSLARFICSYRSKPLGRDKSPPSESVKKPCLLIKNKKESTFRTPFCFWRRERDSNPRNLSVQRFSRPPQSTTLPNLQNLPLISNLQQINKWILDWYHLLQITHLHQPFEEIKFANISQRLSASTQLAKLESSLTRYLDYISSKILRKFVDPVRLELTTPCVQGRCSSHLSYEPLKSNIVVRFYIEDQF